MCFVSFKLCVLVHDVMSECLSVSGMYSIISFIHRQQERQFSSKHYLSNTNKTHTVDTGNCIPRIYMYMYALPPLKEREREVETEEGEKRKHFINFMSSLSPSL